MLTKFLVLLSCVGAAADATADSLLLTAARKNNLDGIAEALKKGANIDAITDSSGQSPLMAGVLAGSTDAVKYLLEKGASYEIGEKDGYTPPHGAGFQGRADIVPILKKFGVDLNHVHADGYQGIHRACWGREQRHTDTVKAFIGAGVRWDEPTKDGRTPLQLTSNPGTQALLKSYQDSEL